MTQINLLPWREKQRQIKKILFGLLMAAFVVLTLVGMVVVHIYLKMQNTDAVERNAYLQSVIDQTASDITALKVKQIIRDKAVSELNLIIDLRKQSFQAVSFLNLLENALPPNILITRVSRLNKIFTLEGIAGSDLDTTNFMKNIEAVKGFRQPTLNVIKSQASAASVTNQEIQFELKVEQD
jgi:type IV pilus assembly protein PilN